MKKLLSTNYSAGAFNFGILVLRLGAGILMMHHGYGKLINFAQMREHFPSFLGLGSTVSLSMDIFAEFFCSLFLILGLFTRLACIPLIIAMLFAIFKVHNLHVFMDGAQANGEPATLYVTAFIVLLFVGPGRVSVDSMIGK